MIRGSIMLACAALSACSSGGATPGPRIAAGDDLHPVVVELYQSQGCSSCPPANDNLNAVANTKGVLALSFAVTYWDQLGWKDQFVKLRYTQRQWSGTAAHFELAQSGDSASRSAILVQQGKGGPIVAARRI